MRSSLSDQSFNSQGSPSATPETQRESDRLKLRLDMTNTSISNLEPRDLIRAISTSIRQVMHCDVVGVWLPDAERRQLRQRLASSDDAPHRNNGFRAGQTLVTCAADSERRTCR